MPFDPIRVEDVKDWLTRAKLDLGAGQNDLVAETPFTGDALFHAQQTVEKTMKAWLMRGMS